MMGDPRIEPRFDREIVQIGTRRVHLRHTGAGIALELAVQRPDLVAGLILDGVALFSAEEQEQLFAGYFEPLIIDERGGHYARTWTRIRDMFIWFPWTRHDPGHLNGSDLPPPATAHRWVSMFFQAASRYAEVYRAAIGHAERAMSLAARQTRPALYLAHERDMLAPHLQRLPPLKPDDRIEETSSAPGQWLAAVRRGLAGHVRTERVSTGELAPVAAPAGDRFLILPYGQLRLRCLGDPQSPPLLMLHDAPASGRALLQLAQTLAADYHVWVPDLPGCGASAPLAASLPLLTDYADALAPLLKMVSDAPLALYGRGCGASIAIALAARQPARIRLLLLDELPLPVPRYGQPDERICPPIRIEADGAHWFRTWQMLRDSQIFWPWYENGATHLLRLPGNYHGAFLHDWVVQVMEQPATAHCLPQAAHREDGTALLGKLRGPVALLARSGHPLAAAATAAAMRLPHFRTAHFDDTQRAAELRRLLGKVHI